MESLRKLVMERFLASAPVGEEVTGILYGSFGPGSIQIEAWRAIDRQVPASPAVPLGDEDAAALAGLLATPPAGSGKPIGWFRSRTRGMAALSPEDSAACARVFGGETCLALILRPSTQRPVAASFSLVTPGAEIDSSQRGVRVALHAPPPSDDSPPAPVSDDVPPVAQQTPEQPLPRKTRRRRWVRPVAAFACGIVLSTIATYLLLDRPLRFRVRPEGSAVILEWNRSVGFLTRVQGADIRIAQSTLRVTQSQLRQGRMSLDAPPGDFSVSLHVRGGIAGPQWAGATVVRSMAAGR